MPNVQGMYWLSGLLVITPLSQAIAFLIETSSWLVRAQSSSTDVGLYVGRSNIYLYSARMFTLIFTASLAFCVEIGYPVQIIFQIIYSTFFLSALFHIVFIYRSIRSIAMKVISGALMLPSRREVGNSLNISNFSDKLFFMTLFTSVIFSISLAAPILGALIVPDFRLSISYIGQIINFFGTIVILLFVDQILFKAIDLQKINDVIMSYVAGRAVGFLLVGIGFFCVRYNL
ncbi:hypothetical protein FHS49_001749 [Sphingobium boeckii]|uniref:Uncharacterized protein n=1 Tax=Sphingobium boeckii TaxID=1082345 RepID=A0A7W9AHD7_9SPHN|nr:hypothetical protein [Sphingobium boeckii]